MNGIIGYGEDALTLWALKNRLREILEKLGDESNQSDSSVFYRPSFGRGGSNTANFGEFDAIVLTKTHVYLIESKWEGEKRVPKRTVKLSKPQCDRHTIFAEYFRKWNSSQGKLSFTAGENGQHLHDAPSKRTVPSMSELANHLQFILSRVATRGDDGMKKDLKNVLLFLHREQDENMCITVEPDDFTPILVRCPPSMDLENDSWFFEMNES